MKRLSQCWALSLLLSMGVTGCAGAARMAEAPAPSQAPAPVLDRSLFSKDVSGALSEQDLQRILDSQMDVSFPLRLGVVALEEPFRAESGAAVGEQGMIASALTASIKGSSFFSHVTDVSTDLPNPHGIEGLRTIAARYRTRYLLVCSARAEDQSHLNNWAWLYPTLIGFFVAPGMTVRSEGMLQASLLDVRSGTVLFTVTEPYRSSQNTWLIGAERHQAEGDAREMQAAAERMARAVLSQTEHLSHWAAAEKRLQVVSGPGAPGGAGSALAAE